MRSRETTHHPLDFALLLRSFTPSSSFKTLEYQKLHMYFRTSTTHQFEQTSRLAIFNPRSATWGLRILRNILPKGISELTYTYTYICTS